MLVINFYRFIKRSSNINLYRLNTCKITVTSRSSEEKSLNGPFAASGHMVDAGGQAAHWDIQNKANSS